MLRAERYKGAVSPEQPWLAVCWATEYEGIGNSYGYSVQNARTRQALEDAGVAIRPDAPIAVHVSPAHLFEPIPGKTNVLCMAWETETLPEGHREGIARADVAVVTWDNTRTYVGMDNQDGGPRKWDDFVAGAAS